MHYDLKMLPDLFISLVKRHAKGMNQYLNVEQVGGRSHGVVWHIDLQEGVELVVAAGQGGSEGFHALVPVHRVRVVQSKRSGR